MEFSLELLSNLTTYNCDVYNISNGTKEFDRIYTKIKNFHESEKLQLIDYTYKDCWDNMTEKHKIERNILDYRI